MSKQSSNATAKPTPKKRATPQTPPVNNRPSPPQPRQKQPAQKQPKALTARAQTRAVTSGPRLPNAPVTKPLTLRMPKGKATSKDAIQERLKKKSPWFTSITDPLRGAGCKIPDETGVETGTCQIVVRDTVQLNGLGFAGARVLSPYVNSQVIASNPAGRNYQKTTTASNPGSSIVWSGPTGLNDGSAWAFPGVSELITVSNAHRIVSAAMYVQPETSLADNNGEIVLFASPFSTIDAPTSSDYINSYKSVTVPVNSNEAAVIRWYPVAREDWSFKSFIRTDGTVLSEQDSSDGAYPPWSFGFIVLGGSATDSPVFRFTIVINYEFIPSFNTLNVLGTGPSPVDAQEVDLVENWVQDMPVAQAISQQAAAVSPSTVSPKHEDEETGFGMFTHMVGEALPFILPLLGI